MSTGAFTSTEYPPQYAISQHNELLYAHEWARPAVLLLPRPGGDRPAVRTHPRTGETVWFNQADHWHPSNLPGDEADALIEAVGGVQNLPRSVSYGDGTPIPGTDLALVREATQRHTLAIPWQAGDLMLVDNVLALHGREPYTGSRHPRFVASPQGYNVDPTQQTGGWHGTGTTRGAGNPRTWRRTPRRPSAIG